MKLKLSKITNKKQLVGAIVDSTDDVLFTLIRWATPSMSHY